MFSASLILLYTSCQFFPIASPPSISSHINSILVCIMFSERAALMITPSSSNDPRGRSLLWLAMTSAASFAAAFISSRLPPISIAFMSRSTAAMVRSSVKRSSRASTDISRQSLGCPVRCIGEMFVSYPALSASSVQLCISSTPLFSCNVRLGFLRPNRAAIKSTAYLALTDDTIPSGFFSLSVNRLIALTAFLIPSFFATASL